MTKRVHRKGFHVQWRKNYSKDLSVNRADRQESKAKSEKCSNRDRSATSEQRDSIERGETNYSENHISETRKKRDRDRRSATTDTFFSSEENSRTEAFKNHLESVFPLNLVQKKRLTDSENSGWNAGGLAIAGIWIIIVGILLILGSVYLLYGIYAFENLFYSLVLSGNGFIIGFLGFLLFLLILIIILIAALFVYFVFGSARIGFIVGGSLIALGFIFILFDL